MSSETLLFTAGWHDGQGPVERRLVARIEPPGVGAPGVHHLRPRYAVRGDAPGPRADRGAGPRAPLVRARSGRPRRPLLRHGTGGRSRSRPTCCPTPSGTTGSSTRARPTGTPSRSRRCGRWPASTTSRPADHDLSFLEHPVAGGSALERSFRHWRDYHEWVVKDRPSPLLAECFAWLEDHFPTDTLPDALSWGDGRIGNMIFRDYQVVAVLDWEMAARRCPRGRPRVDVLSPPVLPGSRHRPRRTLGSRTCSAPRTSASPTRRHLGAPRAT